MEEYNYMQPGKTISPLTQLKRMVQSDDDIELLPGLSEQQLKEFTQSMPTKTLPQEIKDLLGYAKGFYHRKTRQEVEFSGNSSFGADENELWNFAVSVTSDGAGNFWLVVVNEQGQWEEVYYACHDPAELTLYARNLTEFLQQLETCFQSDISIHDYRKSFENSSPSEDFVWNGFITKTQALNTLDETLNRFSSQLPENFQVIDLRNKANGSGFSLNKVVYETIQKHPSLPIWGIEHAENTSFLRKLFSLFSSNKKQH